MRNSLLLFILAILVSGCVKRINNISNNMIKDGKYDSEYPRLPVSEDIEKIMRSVKMVSTIATYESYDFNRNTLLEKNMLNALNQQKYSVKRYFTKPASGTATIIYYLDNRIGLVTCAHIVDFPDTIIHHYTDKDRNETEYIRNISIRVRHAISVLDLPEIKNYKVLAMDKKMDIAIIGREFSSTPIFPIPLLSYPAGSAEELNWGDIVYLFGYPRGTKMVTHSIVSNPDRDRNHSFVLDAVSARGISGGPIFAIRDGVPNFEFVGLAKAMAAENYNYLVPHDEYNISGYDISRPYEEEVFVNKQELIHYGILYTISVESIKEFIDDNESILRKKGYSIKYFFKD